MICENKEGKKEIHNIMIKNENVIPDLVSMQFIRLFTRYNNRIVKKAHVITYPVVPLTCNSGLIYIVKNCKTLYDISQEFSLQNFLLEHNKSKNVSELRETFQISCAFQSIMSYLLGLGDRHLNNILMSYEGQIFHCDFSYILGNECSHKIKLHKLKLTSEMIDCLGGRRSVVFANFKQLCKDIFVESRKNMLSFVILLLPLVHLLNINLKTFKQHVYDRFFPEQDENQASIMIDTCIKKDSSDYAFRMEKIYDTLYDLKRRYF